MVKTIKLDKTAFDKLVPIINNFYSEGKLFIKPNRSTTGGNVTLEGTEDEIETFIDFMSINNII